MKSVAVIAVGIFLTIVYAQNDPGTAVNGVWRPVKCVFGNTTETEERLNGTTNTIEYHKGNPNSINYDERSGDGLIQGKVNFTNPYGASCELVKNATEAQAMKFQAVTLSICKYLSNIVVTNEKDMNVTFGPVGYCDYKKND